MEPNETFSLVLSEPVGATIASPSATATIIDSDDPAPDPNAITVIADSVQIVEGTSPSPSIARFTVRLSHAATAPFTVIYTTADGTAFADADYTAASGTLTFAPGETSKTIDVPIRADNEPELTENLTLVFERGAVATCAILDDDADPAKERSIRH